MRALVIVLLILGTAWWQTYGPSSSIPKAEARGRQGNSLDFLGMYEPPDRPVAVTRKPALWASEWFTKGSSERAYSRIISTTDKGLLAFFTLCRADAHQPPRSDFPSLAEVNSGALYFPGKASFTYDGDLLLIGDDAKEALGLQSIENEHGFINLRMLNMPGWDGLRRLRFEPDGGLTLLEFKQDPIDALDLDKNEVPRRYVKLMSK